MASKVILSLVALSDLNQAKQWLSQPGAGETAKRKLRAIRGAIRQLSETPSRWPVRDHPGVRESPIEGYRVMYEVFPDTGDDSTAGNVRVLRVFGPYMSRERL